jgi:hypothetical protein
VHLDSLKEISDPWWCGKQRSPHILLASAEAWILIMASVLLP